MGLDNFGGLMGKNTLATSTRTSAMAKANLNGKTGVNTKESGTVENNTVWESTGMARAKKGRANGLKVKESVG